MRRKIIVTLVGCLFSVYVQSQERSKSDIKEVVFEIAALVKSNYVLADKGNVIAENFIKDFNAGRFDFADSWKQLDSVMTKSLKDISNDGHLYVRNSPELVKELKQAPENEEKAETSSFFNNDEAFSTNFGFQKVEIIEGNIGYLKLSKINISSESLETLDAAMEFVKNTSALIIDLRDNGGGGSAVGAVLESFFFEKEKDLLEFTSRSGTTQLEKTVPREMEKRYTEPLYILINSNTASAAEAFAFVLKHYNRAIIVGEPSAGAAYMNSYFPVNDHLVLSVSTSAPFIPGTTLTWERTGVQPDKVVRAEEAKAVALELIGNKKL